MKKKLISLAMLVTVFAMQVVGVSAASKTTTMAVVGNSKGYYEVDAMDQEELAEVAKADQTTADLIKDINAGTRGICKMDSDNNLTEIIETKNIIKTGDGAIADNQVLDIDSLVSMNMWGLTLDFLDVLGEGFKEFFDKEVCQDPLKSEYLIPVFIGQLLEQGKLNVKVLRTDDTWYGMTYKEDVITVKERFSEMLENKFYSEELFNDISF